MKARFCLLAATLTLLALCASYALANPPGFAKDFTYKQADGAVDIMKGDKVVARYVYKDTTHPYIYPLTSPSGLAVTRNYPMKEVAGEPKDHPHHRSMWLGFGDVNGVDFWTDADKSGKIVQKSIAFDPIGPGAYWSIHTTNDWVLANGKKLMEDERKVAFYSCDSGTIVITTIRLTASVCDVRFNDSKEGFFAVRVAPSLALKDSKGHILNSVGDKDADAWGKPATWVDYTGEIDGKTVGITMFDSHRNFGYPTYWHARDYGLLAANPFGGKAFTGDEKKASPFSLQYGNSAEFIYAVLIHDGKLDADTINSLAEDMMGKGSPRTTPGAAPAGKDAQKVFREAPSRPTNSELQQPAPAGAEPQQPKAESRDKTDISE